MRLIKKHIKTKFIIVLLFATLINNAQPPRQFVTCIGGSGYDYGYDVKQTLDNGYIITGSTSSFGQGYTDVYLLKLDSMGQIKFQKAIGHGANEVGKSVVQLSDSSYVIVGYTNSIGFGGYDIYLIKTDKNGNEIWHKTYGGSDWDFAYSLQATTDGGFIICGSTYSIGRGAADGYVIKTDADGDEQWHKTYGGINDDEFKSVIQTNDGNYALTGYTKSYNDVDSGDVWIFKLDLNGDSLWCKFHGGNKEDYGLEVIQHPNNDYYIAGATASFGAGLLDGYALRLDVNGNQTGHVEDGNSSNNEVFNSIVVSKRSTNYVTVIEKENFPAYGLQFKVMEMSLGLLYSMATDYGSTKDDETFKLIATNDKGYACVGYSLGYNSILTNCYLAKIDSNLNGGNYSIVSLAEIDHSNIQLSLFPNPVTDELTIVSNNEFGSNIIKMLDVLGKEVTDFISIEIISEKKIKLHTEALANGIYYLKIGNRTEKILIENKD